MSADLSGGSGFAPLRGLLVGAAPAFAAGLHRALMTLAPLTAAARSSTLAFAAFALAFTAAEGLFLPLAKGLSAALEVPRTAASQGAGSKTAGTDVELSQIVVDQTAASKGPRADVDQTADSKGPRADVDQTADSKGPRADVDQTADSKGPRADVDQTAASKGPRADVDQTAASKGPRADVDQTADLELPAGSKPPRPSGGQGEVALRLLLLASFIFLLLSAPFASLHFALVSFGFEASVTRTAVKNFFLLLPGLFCRQTFVFFAKLGMESELRLPQVMAGIIGLATSLLFATVASQSLGVWAASFSAGYTAAVLIEIGLLSCFKAFRSLFEGCESQEFCHNWAEPCERLLSGFALNFVEIAPFSIVFMIIARHGTTHLVTVALLLITEEAATVLTRALAVGVRSAEENSYIAQILASGLVLIAGSLQSLFIFNCSSALVRIYSDDQRVQVLYKSSLFGFLSFILVTSLTKVWRSCLTNRRLALTLLLFFSRWLFRLGFGLLLTLLISQSFLFCLPIVLPLGGVIEATGVLLLFLKPCHCRHSASETEKQLLCPKENAPKRSRGFVTMRICGVMIVSISCIALIFYGCIRIQ